MEDRPRDVHQEGDGSVSAGDDGSSEGNDEESSVEDDDSYAGENNSFRYDVDDSTQRLTEEVIDDIEDSYEDLLSLSIGWATGTVDRDYDWEAIGRSIGENTNLERLRVYSCDETLLFEGIARNRCLTHLDISDCRIAPAIFETLVPFFERNRSLRCLRVRGCHGDHGHYLTTYEQAFLGKANIEALACALSRCDRYSLDRVDFGCNKIRDDDSAVLISSLNGMVNLQLLRLDSNLICLEGCKAIALLLENPEMGLRELFLGNNSINDECIQILADALTKNNSVKVIDFGGVMMPHTHSGGRCEVNPITGSGWRTLASKINTENLRKISIRNCNLCDESAVLFANAFANATRLKSVDISNNEAIGVAGWQALIATWLQHLTAGLTTLDISSNSLDDECVVRIATALANTTTLKKLRIVKNESITPGGWLNFFRVLPSFQSSLKELHLQYNAVDDDGIAVLADFLGSSTVEILFLLGTAVTPDGWRVFSNVLRNPRTALKSLYLNNNVNDGVLIDFANALVGNVSLKVLHFYVPARFTQGAWNAVSNLLCNKSTISSTYNSNHTLEEIFASNNPEEIWDFLAINKNNDDKEEVARDKILEHNFYEGHDNLHIFSDMELNVLPNAISWMGRDGYGLNLLHQFVCSMPSLFECKVKEKGRRVGKKSKFGH